MAMDQRTVTPARRAANRAAAQKSTGPKTAEGKQRAAFNSFKHGAFAEKDHTLQEALARSGGDPAELDARRQQLLDNWQPATHQQELLAGDLAWLYWLRDQAAGALIEGQRLRPARDQLARDERRFNARHRACGLTLGDCQGGCVNLPGSEAKFACAGEMLDELQARLAQANWSGNADGFGLRSIQHWELRAYLWGGRPNARGEKASRLWNACAEDKAKADDPRVGKIRALLEEERAALAEEAELFRRRQELDIEHPEEQEFTGFHPLSETWQRAALGIERLDRQINAKIRLLLKLQASEQGRGNREQKTGSAGAGLQVCDDGNGLVAQRSPANAAAFREAADKPQGQTTDLALQAPPENRDETAEGPSNRAVAATDLQKIAGTKPSETLESTKPLSGEASQPDALARLAQ